MFAKNSPAGLGGSGLLALCFIVPAFSFANGNESDSVLELDCWQKTNHTLVSETKPNHFSQTTLKLASEPFLFCCMARLPMSSVSCMSQPWCGCCCLFPARVRASSCCLAADMLFDSPWLITAWSIPSPKNLYEYENAQVFNLVSRTRSGEPFGRRRRR